MPDHDAPEHPRRASTSHRTADGIVELILIEWKYRLSRRGNRTLNSAIHMAAVTQLRHQHSEGRIYFERKVAEGKSKREALRSLRRHVSNAIYRQLVADANRVSR